MDKGICVRVKMISIKYMVVSSIDMGATTKEGVTFTNTTTWDIMPFNSKLHTTKAIHTGKVFQEGITREGEAPLVMYQGLLREAEGHSSMGKAQCPWVWAVEGQACWEMPLVCLIPHSVKCLLQVPGTVTGETRQEEVGGVAEVGRSPIRVGSKQMLRDPVRKVEMAKGRRGK